MSFTMESPEQYNNTLGLNFLQELQEARLTHNTNNIQQLSYIDCCDRVYLLLLGVELLTNFDHASSFTRSYAKRSLGSNQFNKFQINGTDLHNLLFIISNESGVNHLKDPDAALSARDTRTVPVSMIRQYLTAISSGSNHTNAYQMFTKLESGLKINDQNYKSIRRVFTSISKSNHSQIKTAITKLLFAFRAKLRSSDLIDTLEKLADVNNLELQNVTDTEPVVSIDDPATGDDLVYIAGIVGSSNVFLALKFMELAARGETIPSSAVKAFRPAIALLTDIISGGAAYVTTLKSLQSQAKRSKKS